MKQNGQSQLNNENSYCRYCSAKLTQSFVDLGYAPPSNAYLTVKQLSMPEIYYPLRVMVCNKCWLVQTEDFARANDLFLDDYAYFSSTSSSWLNHAKNYCENVTSRFNLESNSMVIEIASNDGYLLKNFVNESIPCLGIEPTGETANVAKSHGISVIEDFFTEKLASTLFNDGKGADLIIGNNVYAHVPDINDFTKGITKLLKADGVVTLEFPHLLKLIKLRQFDTIYHEHFSYLSLTVVKTIFESHGLKIFDVEELPTHGGSLRVYGSHRNSMHETLINVENIINEEIKFGLNNDQVYEYFQYEVDFIKNSVLSFLLESKRNKNSVAAYGAAAKGNTLLNYAGIKPDLLPVVYDAAPSKQGKLMPGSHIPIKHPNELYKDPPDFLIILPWNLGNEISTQLLEIKNRGTKLISFVPEIFYW
jgi:SAM-dependent methyltransferase